MKNKEGLGVDSIYFSKKEGGRLLADVSDVFNFLYKSDKVLANKFLKCANRIDEKLNKEFKNIAEKGSTWDSGVASRELSPELKKVIYHNPTAVQEKFSKEIEKRKNKTKDIKKGSWFKNFFNK